MGQLDFKKYNIRILNIAVIIAALFVTKIIYQKQEQNIASLEAEKENEIGKNIALEEIEALKKRTLAFKGKVNNKELSSIINTLGYLAENALVRIVSIKPLEIKSGPLYNKYPHELTVSADSYHVIGEFIGKLENHPDIYMVDEIKINTSSNQGQRRGQDTLTAELRVSTILFK